MSTANTDHATARQLLQRAVKSTTAEFRSGQWEAIDRIVNHRKRLLVVERTGWGKSSVYFIATRILRGRGRGPTLIVSPLLALMRNQVEAAERLRIKALSLNSTNQAEWPALKQAILANQADALLISPERLANDEFMQSVLLPISNQMGLLVVDEAHCISDWGHDFRPDYRRLLNILQRMPPNMPILGTTATANDRVINDIVSQLGNVEIQRGALMRESLALQNIRLPDQAARLAWLAEQIPHLTGTGIVYTLTKRDAEQVAKWLNLHNISARAYYSDVKGIGFDDSNAYRQHLEAQLLSNEIKVLVATTALGMGYDKPDLGFVIHYQAPNSIIAYYQQVGRAGRAIERAVGVLLSGREDEDIQAYFRDKAFPSEENVQSILQALANSDGLTVRDLEADINLRYGRIEHALKYLSVENPAPLIKDGSHWRRTAVPYRMDRAKIERLTQQRLTEWQEIVAYIESSTCLMTFLARALDDKKPQTCGKCAACIGKPVVPTTYANTRAIEATRYLRQADFPLICNKQVAANAFPLYGFRGNFAPNLRAEEGRILSRWGDAGWGRSVAEDKRAGHFRDELVDAMVEMIQVRWKPSPAPTWVTCVPSLARPTLVPDFARRLATKLGLPFVDAVVKVHKNEPQKIQQNRFYQCKNLDGAFRIRPGIKAGPALLFDDMVDSVWTMTVIAALLRKAGAGAIFPVALASTSTGD